MTDDWRDHAACIGAEPDIFFPERGESPARAKAFCARCPVRQECLEQALDDDERHGVFGGTTPQERRSLQTRWQRRCICAQCGVKFPAKPVRKYCSQECEDRWQNQNRPQVYGLGRNCVVCGAWFPGGHYDTCSNWCGAVARKWAKGA